MGGRHENIEGVQCPKKLRTTTAQICVDNRWINVLKENIFFKGQFTPKIRSETTVNLQLLATSRTVKF